MTAALTADLRQYETEMQAAAGQVQKAKQNLHDYEQAEKDGGFDVVKSTSRLNDE